MKHCKKFVALLLAAALLLGALALPVSAAELPFTDVPDNIWYTDAVKYAYENGLFNGDGKGKFNPGGSMTRGMFVQVLANKADNYNKADWTGKSSFSDVNKSKYYAAPVEWASSTGLVSGVGEGKFAPERNVTREQMAVILYNYAKKTGNDTSFDSGALSSFSDASSVSGWAKEAMQWAVSHKIVSGSNGRLSPAGNAQRCQVAQVMKSAAPVLVKNEVEIPDAPAPTPDPDPSPDPNPTPDPGFVDPTPDNLPEGALTYQEFVAAFPNLRVKADHIVNLYVTDESKNSDLKKALNKTGTYIIRKYAIAQIVTLKEYYNDFDHLESAILNYSFSNQGDRMDMFLWYYPGKEDHYLTVTAF